MHSTPNYHYCLLGAIGWDHASWIGTFYPEDLPPEWRLNYYSTAFDCVYLPYATWQAAALEALAEWRHDTLEQFRFLLEAPPAPSEADTARIAALGEKAVLVHPYRGPPLVWLEPDANLRQLAQTLQALEATPPFYLVSVSADFAQLEQARTLLEVLGY
jgi:uncharacterized protein YecE (DUF72 family)